MTKSIARGAPESVDQASETLPQLVGTVEIPRIELIVEREAGKDAPRTVVVDSGYVRIGSHASNDLVLKDPLVSRFHCELTRGASGWRVVDSGSLNGTRVGGVRARDADLELPSCPIELGASRIIARELRSTGKETLVRTPSFGAMYGSSVVMRRLFDRMKHAARSDSDVLIEGESGTGKELVTRELVQRSSRADKPFVVVDCGAISPNLIESELFGHTRGAFTGADRARVGAFEDANTGTLFLDEIGELPLEVQPKLLRVLAEREIRRMGENQRRKIDVRVVAATNRKLEREVNQGRFREDLFFRLSVVTLRVPPLRDRIEDVPMLVYSFLDALDANSKADLFTPEVMAEMRRYEWPGNVRELRNFVERRIIFGGSAEAAGEVDEVDEVNERPSSPAPAPASVNIEVPFKQAKEAVVEAFEKRYLAALLEWSEGNVSRAARKANIDRVYLHRLLRHYSLKPGSSLND
jgi:DNA-binding NtrC family response regulator